MTAITNNDIKNIPHIQDIVTTVLPKIVNGYISPYPTVVIVTKISQYPLYILSISVSGYERSRITTNDPKIITPTDSNTITTTYGIS